MSRMYLAMVTRWFSSWFHGGWRRNLMRSGMVTGLILAGAVVGLTLVYQQHMRGNFHKLKAQIGAERQDAPIPRPGGQEAIMLTRTRLAGISVPEFVSVTMLPGRGLNILQITAYLPEKGEEVSLLASPSVDDATRAMSGVGADANGAASLTMGGAFELPWAGPLWGVATQGQLSTAWRGRAITLPGAGTSKTASVAKGGLLLSAPAESAETSAMPDGGQAEATFQQSDFGAHWPSKTDVNITVLLSSRSIELTVIAHNVGDVAEPVGIGWHPIFAILDGHREQIRLRIPGQMRAEIRDRQGSQPSGRLLPVSGSAYDFTARGGAALGRTDLDESFVQLRQEFLDSGPAAEFNDPVNHYGLRLMALSSAIKAMRVVARADGDSVSIAPQFNYDDPFGREWSKDTDTGMVVLQPGQSTQWKVRLELFPISSSKSAQ